MISFSRTYPFGPPSSHTAYYENLVVLEEKFNVPT